MKNYENMPNEEIKEQLEWSDHHEFSYNYAIWAFEEIDRLNNIIEELEKYIKENSIISIYYNTSDGCQWVDQFRVLDKLKELKENNNE